MRIDNFLFNFHANSIAAPDFTEKLRVKHFAMIWSENQMEAAGVCQNFDRLNR
jgi:hypothetical protein